MTCSHTKIPQLYLFCSCLSLQENSWFFWMLRKYGRKVWYLEWFFNSRMYPDIAKSLTICWFLDWVIFFQNRYIYVFRFTNPSRTDVVMCIVFFSFLKNFCHLLYYLVFPSPPLTLGWNFRGCAVILFYICFSQSKTFLDNNAVN